MKVLIADDDPVCRRVLRAAVEQAGHEVLEAEDGQEAWRLFEGAADVDVVISDWVMPHTSGPELCRRVRSSPRGQHVYFVVLTGLDAGEHLLDARDAGVDDYLTKPLHQGALTMRLATALRVTSLHRRLVEQNGALEDLNGQLRAQALHDPLTGLYNRLRLDEDLDLLRDRGERYGQSYGLILCDVDHFKSYNDRYGHVAGDEVLRRVAQRIARQCRAGDSAYRYGGEEFLVVLPQQDAEGTATVAERLRSAVEGLQIPHAGNEPVGIVTISCGTAALGGQATTAPQRLLMEADAALYRAKTVGRNRVMTQSAEAGD